jgi:RimJ/RimL family protein N-acetyltransferase
MLLPPYRLPDGTQVLLRPIRADDKGDLSAAFARLSPESQRLRFLAPKSHLTTPELRYLTEVDGVDHVAIVAVLASDPRVVAGVARFIRLPHEPDAAEAAILVGDPWQGVGLGRHIGLALADLARARGIRRFHATLLSSNLAAHRLFVAISERLRSEVSGGIEELVADLAA